MVSELWCLNVNTKRGLFIGIWGHLEGISSEENMLSKAIYVDDLWWRSLSVDDRFCEGAFLDDWVQWYSSNFGPSLFLGLC